jgi:dTDP-4-amino-4,6-dideoxygalactose transaminase
MNDQEEFRARCNYKMADLQAALGLSQLKKLATFITRRREIAGAYNEMLDRLGMPTPRVPVDCEPVWYRYVVLLDSDAEPFIQDMNKRCIECRRPVFKPIHRYLGLSGYPVTDEIWRRAVSIPLYPALTDAEVESIVKSLRLILPKHCTGKAC